VGLSNPGKYQELFWSLPVEIASLEC